VSSVNNAAQFRVHPLRALTVDPRKHPRRQPHLSAASGLVCLNGRAYVIADDELHLAVYSEHAKFGSQYRIAPGELPESKTDRKRLKPDFETLFALPAAAGSTGTRLVALGSGSRENRNVGVVIQLDAAGDPLPDVHHFDLTPLYAPMAARIGEINVEGAMVIGDEFVVINRAVPEKSDNATARFRLRDLLAVIEGRGANRPPGAIEHYALGDIDGVALGFTDAAALPDGGWLFTAVAEDTRDSYADGPFAGSAVGVVSARGVLQSLHRLQPSAKVEGIDVRVDDDGIGICMVTDADDPARSAWLLQARL
jgi:hypothetical protein